MGELGSRTCHQEGQLLRPWGGRWVPFWGGGRLGVFFTLFIRVYLLSSLPGVLAIHVPTLQYTVLHVHPSMNPYSYHAAKIHWRSLSTPAHVHTRMYPHMFPLYTSRIMLPVGAGGLLGVSPPRMLGGAYGDALAW